MTIIFTNLHHKIGNVSFLCGRMRLTTTIVLLALLFIGGGITSCKKNNLPFTENHLDFSVDTVLFDTIFTTIGSTTKRFRVYNRNNEPIRIDAIELMGDQSYYRLNIDGLAQNSAQDIELDAGDSLFIFVEVTLDPNNQSTPLIIEDSIRFETNGENQYVQLATWGQDAYFHRNEVVSGTWANDKPHVIYGLAAVGYPGIDSNLNLTIPANTQVHLHKNSSLIIYKSSLTINGMKDQEVVFQGDRLEAYYDDKAGQWGSIRFIQANPSSIDYAIVKNGQIGIQVDTTGTTSPTLELNNTIVQNNSYYGILVNAGAYVQATNCLFGNSGLNSGLFYAGGKYEFTNCTFGNSFPASRSTPLFKIINYFEGPGSIYVRPIEQSYFRNCVIYGSQTNEFDLDTITHPIFDLTFDHCLIKKEEIVDQNPSYINTIWNQDPSFTAPVEHDYHFDGSSPLIDAGTTTGAPATDLDGISRSTPDIGCYEYQ